MNDRSFPTPASLIYSGPVVNKWTRCHQAINKMFTNISLTKLKTVLIDIMTMLEIYFWTRRSICKFMNKFCWKQSKSGRTFYTLFSAAEDLRSFAVENKVLKRLKLNGWWFSSGFRVVCMRLTKVNKYFESFRSRGV